MPTRRVYFGKLIALLDEQAVHGHFTNARDYTPVTGIQKDLRNHHLLFETSVNGIHFVYDTVTRAYRFMHRLDGTGEEPIAMGWDGLSSSEQMALIGEIFGFLEVNGMVDEDLMGFIHYLGEPPQVA